MSLKVGFWNVYRCGGTQNPRTQQLLTRLGNWFDDVATRPDVLILAEVTQRGPELASDIVHQTQLGSDAYFVDSRDKNDNVSPCSFLVITNGFPVRDAVRLNDAKRPLVVVDAHGLLIFGCHARSSRLAINDIELFFDNILGESALELEPSSPNTVASNAVNPLVADIATSNFSYSGNSPFVRDPQIFPSVLIGDMNYDLNQNHISSMGEWHIVKSGLTKTHRRGGFLDFLMANRCIAHPIPVNTNVFDPNNANDWDLIDHAPILYRVNYPNSGLTTNQQIVRLRQEEKSRKNRERKQLDRDYWGAEDYRWYKGKESSEKKKRAMQIREMRRYKNRF